MEPMIEARRACGCDCRDSDQFVQDPQLVSPSCCAVCGPNGDQKPPCAFVAHFPCGLTYQGELLTYFGQEVVNGVNSSSLFNHGYATAQQANVYLRPICEFQNTCTFVSLRYGIGQEACCSFSGFFTQGPYAAHNAACTWSERLEGVMSQATINTLARWSLDINAKTLTHPCGIRYGMATSDSWDCYGPNTMQLICPTQSVFGGPPCVDWQIQIPGLPKFVCVTPAISTRTYQPKCCANCFKFDLPAGNSAHIPAQTITFLPDETDSLGGACNYQAAVIDCGLSVITQVGGFGDSTFYPSFLRVASPMDTGNPSTAIMTLRTTALGAIQYQCDRLTCTGGLFYRTIGNTSFPDTITLVATDCVWSENNNEGPCPALCVGDAGSDGSAGTKGGYVSESVRCTCCDPFCDCMPGMFKVYCGTHKGCFTTCPNDGTCSSGSKWCKGGHTPVHASGGVSREACFSVTAVDGSTHEICINVYCSPPGVWTSDWYCDGSYDSSVLMVSSCCPLTAQCAMPAMACLPGCTGCLGINVPVYCEPITACCSDSDEPSVCHISFTSTCAALDGHSVTMSRTSSHRWDNSTDIGSFQAFTLICSDGTWTLTISSIGCTIVMTSTDSTCLPFISGTFPTVTISCVGGACLTGTISAVLTV